VFARTMLKALSVQANVPKKILLSWMPILIVRPSNCRSFATAGVSAGTGGVGARPRDGDSGRGISCGMAELAEVKWRTRFGQPKYQIKRAWTLHDSARGPYDLCCYRHASSRSDSHRTQVLYYSPNLQRAKELASHRLVACPHFRAAVRFHLCSVIRCSITDFTTLCGL
jgi:hypothetical protein